MSTNPTSLQWVTYSQTCGWNIIDIGEKVTRQEAQNFMDGDPANDATVLDAVEMVDAEIVARIRALLR